MAESISLTEHTRNLLLEQYPWGNTTEQFAKDSGLDHRWILRFRSGEFDDPHASKIQTLYEALTGKRLVA